MKKLIIIFAALIAAGCASGPPPDLFVQTPQMLENRQKETRRYDGLNEEEILIASSNVLQDLGYTLENSETKLGVMTASKVRDTNKGGEIAVNVVLILLGGMPAPMSKDQVIRASLVVKPVLDDKGNPLPKNHNVRIIFQKIVRYDNGNNAVETLKDPELYTGFHDKLSKSVFLEAHKI